MCTAMFRIFACLFLLVGIIQAASATTTTEQNMQKSYAFGYELLEHHLEQLQHSNAQLSKQLYEVSNTSEVMLVENSLILKQILRGIEGTFENSKKIRDVLTEKLPIQSCKSAKTSGVYSLLIDSSPVPYDAFCEMSSFGGGWTVIQQRLNGSVDFNRSWAEYRDGFGTVGNATEFWLGLEAIYLLTNQSVPHELMIELKSEQGKYGYGRYQNFKVAGENDGYRLDPLYSFEGSIGEHFNECRGEQFSTYDRDHDKNTNLNCAFEYSGGWWFYDCNRVTLNGPFEKDIYTGRGIFWLHWSNAATYSRMMIRQL